MKKTLGVCAVLLFLPLVPLCAATGTTVGIEEKRGAFVPADATFTDADGASVTLGSLLGKPTILTLVYYRCPNVCDYLLTNVAGSLTALAPDAGTLYNVLSVSINDAETTADARKARRIALETVQAPFPQSAWHFLVGTEPNIQALTDAVGYRFQHDGTYFDHPVAIIVLSPTGKVVRYMYGESFLPAELRLSVLEAQKGVVAASVARVLRVCFAVDPVSHRLVFRTLQIVATVTIAVALAFVAFLVVNTRRRRRAQA